VIGPHGIKQLLETNIKLSDTYLTYQLEITELEHEKNHSLGEIEGVSITASPLKHKTACFGYVLVEPERPASLDVKKAQKIAGDEKLNGKIFSQLKDGKDVTLESGVVIRAEDVLDRKRSKKLVLLGDTCESSSVLSAGKDCDVLVHESTLDSSQQEKAIERGHSTPVMAGKFACELNARFLILTHFSPRYDVQNKSGDLTISDLQKEAQDVSGDCKVFSAKDFDTFNFVSDNLELEKTNESQNQN